MASAFFALATGLICAKCLAQWVLNRLNRQSVLAHSNAVPLAFEGRIPADAYRKSVAYSLAKNRFSQFEITFDVAVLLLILLSGIVPACLALFQRTFGASTWAMAGFLVSLGLLLAIPQLPVDWYHQFRLEQSFGFNTSTVRTWCADRLKAVCLGIVIGWPMAALILKLVAWTGPWWWLWAWLVVMAFQLIMVVIAPVLILPLFNKLAPLPEGPLRNRLLELGRTTGFHARSILVMDGSRRSRHSNAFFTGLGRFRKIVLFDTLIEQLEQEELAAVLAHEIGHFRKKHIPKMLVASCALLLGAFYCIAQLSTQSWFFEAFGFSSHTLPSALALFVLLSSAFTFWFSPLSHAFSRRYEYQADAYAADALKESTSLLNALRKLNQENLSNLTPHPLYSAFYYSHPTLLEREKALIASRSSTELPPLRDTQP